MILSPQNRGELSKYDKTEKPLVKKIDKFDFTKI